MIYTYRCLTCDTQQDAKRSMDDRYNGPHCAECGGDTKKVMNAVASTQIMGACDNPGYISPLSGKWIDSKRERRNEIAKYDVIEKG